MTGVAYLEVLRVGVHLAVYLLLHGGSGVGEVNAVAEGLAHFRLAVNSGKSALSLVLGYHSLGHYQSFTVNSVELLDYLPCLFKHRKLILAYGNYIRVESRDVSRL